MCTIEINGNIYPAMYELFHIYFLHCEIFNLSSTSTRSYYKSEPTFLPATQKRPKTLGSVATPDTNEQHVHYCSQSDPVRASRRRKSADTERNHGRTSAETHSVQNQSILYGAVPLRNKSINRPWKWNMSHN